MASVSANPCRATPCIPSTPFVHHPSSIFVTFKVAQLVSSFRKRIKTRVLSRTSSIKVQSKVQDKFCKEFEHQAFDEIDKYLGRKSVRDKAKDTSCTRNGYKAVAKECVEENAYEPLQSWHVSFTSLLAQLDAQTWQTSLTTIAKDDKLFLQHRGKFKINHLSPKELTTLLSLVKQLLTTVRNAHQQCLGSGYQLCLGTETVKVDIDESFLANLEHCLLCLQTEIIRALVSNGSSDLQRHMFECQKEQHRRCEDWFFEFPDARHPLSTTWPWSLRPSLAVIWGVCWMFYVGFDEFGVYFEDDREFDWTATDRGALQELSGPADQGYTDTSPPPRTFRPSPGSPATQPHQAYEPRLPENATSSYPQTNGGLYESALPGTYNVRASAQWSAPQSGISADAQASSAYDHDLVWAVNETCWDNNSPLASIFTPTPTIPAYIYAPNSGSRGHLVTPPSIRVTIPQAPPLDRTYTGASSPAYPSQRTISPSSTNLSPGGFPYTPPMGNQSNERSRGDSISTNSSRQQASTSPTSPLVRSPGGGLRPDRGDPPTRDNQLVCEHAGCESITFDRKCEWSKHMDKHDRPYRCNDPACTKLQGFTYSGGLLRHQREVHNKHGGVKEQFHCPEVNCKRHTGSGFTRRENYLEHMRRVHKRDPRTPPAVVKAEADANEDAPTPSSGVSETVAGPSTCLVVMGKRKRERFDSPAGKEEGETDTDTEDLQGEVKRLKSENATMKEQMSEMQRQVAELVRQQQQQQR